MRIIKNIWAQLHRFIFWAILLSLFWAWIYLYVGDAPRDEKVVLCIDAYAMERRPLSLRLEDEGLPQGIEMIQARSFDYDIFGGTLEGDLYLMRESILKATMEESPEKLAPLELEPGERGWDWQGACYGILAFDPATQTGPAMSYIQYTPLPEPEREAYYLCLDASSPNPAAALEVARTLLGIKN